jgi:hypothetical protein
MKVDRLKQTKIKKSQEGKGSSKRKRDSLYNNEISEMRNLMTRRRNIF